MRSRIQSTSMTDWLEKYKDLRVEGRKCGPTTVGKLHGREHGSDLP